MQHEGAGYFSLICARERIPCGMEDLEIRRRAETMQTTALLRPARTPRRFKRIIY